MKKRTTEMTRRGLMKGAAFAAASAATISIVPSSVLGGPGKAAAPSDTFGAALMLCVNCKFSISFLNDLK